MRKQRRDGVYFITGLIALAFFMVFLVLEEELTVLPALLAWSFGFVGGYGVGILTRRLQK